LVEVVGVVVLCAAVRDALVVFEGVLVRLRSGMRRAGHRGVERLKRGLPSSK
jgi:hypothetical protein